MRLRTNSRKNITQQVNINTNQSKNYNVLCGVPIALFITDFPLFIVISIRYMNLFADDTTLFDNGLD